MSVTQDIPAHIDEIDPAWLQSILVSGGHLTQGSVLGIDSG